MPRAIDAPPPALGSDPRGNRGSSRRPKRPRGACRGGRLGHGVELPHRVSRTAVAPTEAVEILLRREDAEADLAAALADEPEWVQALTIVPLERDERDV